MIIPCYSKQTNMGVQRVLKLNPLHVYVPLTKLELMAFAYFFFLGMFKKK